MRFEAEPLLAAVLTRISELPAPPSPNSPGRLDSIGRWFLETFDYRVWGILFIATIVLFCLWRRLWYEMWATRNDCFHLALSLIGGIGGITTMVVFLFTKPPAVEMLSTTMLLFLGLALPIMIFGEVLPRLKVLFFPPEVPKPPADLAASGREPASK
jgi:hypothetical protein